MAMGVSIAHAGSAIHSIIVYRVSLWAKILTVKRPQLQRVGRHQGLRMVVVPRPQLRPPHHLLPAASTLTLRAQLRPPHRVLLVVLTLILQPRLAQLHPTILTLVRIMTVNHTSVLRQHHTRSSATPAIMGQTLQHLMSIISETVLLRAITTCQIRRLRMVRHV